MNNVPTSEPPRPHWHEGLKCHIDRIDYDFRTGTARLFLPPYNVTSMTGALALGTAVDLRCKLIQVYSIGKRTTPTSASMTMAGGAAATATCGVKLPTMGGPREQANNTPRDGLAARF